LLALVGELFEFFDENPAGRIRVNQSSTIPLASLVNLPVNLRAPQPVFVAVAGKSHWIFFTSSTAFSKPLSCPLPSSFRGERIPLYNEFLVRIQQDSLTFLQKLYYQSVNCYYRIGNIEIGIVGSAKFC
jgi:hypothetical protein